MKHSQSILKRRGICKITHTQHPTIQTQVSEVIKIKISKGRANTPANSEW